MYILCSILVCGTNMKVCQHFLPLLALHALEPRMETTVESYSQKILDHNVAQISINVGDGTVSVRNVDVSPAGKYEQICGYADAPDAEEPGSLLVHFPNAPAGSYWILDTDYENYASVYSCQSILGLFQIEYGWLLLRDLNTSEDIIAKGREAFTKNGLDISKYELVNHENCQYDLPDVPPCN